MSKKPEIKSCICGNNDLFVDTYYPIINCYSLTYHIKCYKCGLSSEYKGTKLATINNWNKMINMMEESIDV